MIKFNEHMVDITKKGITNVHMVFEEKQKNMTYYDTPFGNLLVGLATNKVDVKEEEEKLRLISASIILWISIMSLCRIVRSAFA